MKQEVLEFGFIMRSGSLDRFERLEIDHRESWGVLVPLDHPLVQNKSVSGKSLLQYPLILPENRTFQKQLKEWLGGEPEVAATYNLIRNALPLVKNGTGLGLCLSDPALPEGGLHFIPLRPAHAISPVLIWRKRRPQSPGAEAFLRFLCHSYIE